MKVLVYSFDVMIGEKFFATLIYKIRKNIFSNTYNIDEEELKRYVYSKYPQLRNKDWHIEQNVNDTYESDHAQPTEIKTRLTFNI